MSEKVPCTYCNGDGHHGGKLVTLCWYCGGSGLMDPPGREGEMGRKKSLKTRIKEIPGEEGWWKGSSERVFQEQAIKLVEMGFTEDEAVELLEAVYCATAECYGG